MKRALPLLLLVLVLSGVAISLLNSGGSGADVEPAPIAEQLAQRDADPLPLPQEEELGSLPSSARRLDAGANNPDSAGMAGVETRPYDGLLTLPLGTPSDPTLRVVAISIEWDEEQACIKELKELGQTDPKAMQQLADQQVRFKASLSEGLHSGVRGNRETSPLHPPFQQDGTGRITA